MGKGLKCRICHHPAKVIKEEQQPRGTWVTYQCQNINCSSCKNGFPWKERKFEGKNY